MKLSTHVLDLATGRPAIGIGIRLERLNGGSWDQMCQTATDADGRCREMRGSNVKGLYRLRFAVEEYYKERQEPCLYPYIEVVVRMWQDADYHVPLLLTANGYTIYRGS